MVRDKDEKKGFYFILFSSKRTESKMGNYVNAIVYAVGLYITHEREPYAYCFDSIYRNVSFSK